MNEEDWPVAVDLDMRFHRRLVSFHRSERIDSCCRTVSAELALILIDRASSAAVTAEQMAHHDEILGLLAERRLKQCAEATLDHLKQAEARLLGPSPLDRNVGIIHGG